MTESTSVEKGKLVVFAAPSGAGKTTIAKKVLTHYPKLQFSISATTRNPREGEINGKDYHFISLESFKEQINDDAFIEWEEFYNGTHYGTLKASVEAQREQGYHVLFDVDVKGALNIKKMFGDECCSIFILPPSIEVLRKRLTSRGTESQEAIDTRMARSAMELELAPEFDHQVKNIELDDAISETIVILDGFFNS